LLLLASPVAFYSTSNALQFLCIINAKDINLATKSQAYEPSAIGSAPNFSTLPFELPGFDTVKIWHNKNSYSKRHT
jgi:hypothetical protein